jgi:hypothetical protein
MDFYGQTIDGEPVTQWPEIHQSCRKLRQFVVSVREYSEDKEVTLQQFKFLHAVVFPTLAREWNTSEEDAEFECKKRWGEQWLIKKALGYRFVLSKTVLTTKQCNKWIENIQAGALRENILIPCPDKDWRETARKMAEQWWPLRPASATVGQARHCRGPGAGWQRSGEAFERLLRPVCQGSTTSGGCPETARAGSRTSTGRAGPETLIVFERTEQ